MFNWNDLRYFLAVAREGSTGAAAKALGVNQSTVQRRLLALEKGLGCVLAERHATGYRLTEHGQTLLASVTDVEGAVDAVERRVASFDDKDVGPVKVTCLVTVGQRIVKSGLLDAFHARHPGISVERRQVKWSGARRCPSRGTDVSNYPKLFVIKKEYDPTGLFFAPCRSPAQRSGARLREVRGARRQPKPAVHRIFPA